jgi:hypothetical protein
MKPHIFERACPLYQEGALTPIFEGNMPPKNRPPKAALFDKILESLGTGTPTNAIRYLTKTGSCSKASFSRPQLAHAIRRIATQTE